MFKFTIRELLLLTLVVALAIGWWLDHRGYDAQTASLRFEAGMYRYLTKFMESEGYRLIWEDDHNMLTVLRPGDSLSGEE